MKKILSIVLLSALFLTMPQTSAAQDKRDARNRTATTIIADGLAQLPAKDATVFNTVLKEIASTGADGVASLAGMLVPATEGKNATVEYALAGLSAFVTAPGNESLRTNVRKGLIAALPKCNDVPNQCFLVSLLQQCGTAEDVPTLMKYANGNVKDLAAAATRALISIPGTDDAIMELVSADNAPVAAIYAVEKKNLAAAEPVLLAKAAKATDSEQLAAIYSALSVIGSEASLPVLAKAAKAVNYAGEATNAYQSYFNLLKKLAADDATSKTALKQAKAIWKKDLPANVHGAALEVITSVLGADALPFVLKDLKNPCIEKRNAALLNICPFADDAMCATIAAAADKSGAAADVLNWFGARKQASQEDWVAAHVTGEQTDAVRNAAIYAAGLIGGEKSLGALVSQLGGRFNDAATASLARFNGKADDALVAALAGSDEVKAAALALIGTRRITAAKEKVFELLNADNKAVADAAYKALSGVTRDGDATRLADLAEKAKGDRRSILQNALKSALGTTSADDLVKFASNRMNATADKALYYPLLAQAGNGAAIASLMEGYKSGNADAAFDALLKVNSTGVIDKLYECAADANRKDAALSRALALIKGADYTSIRKFRLFEQALSMTPSAGVANSFIEALGTTPIPSALTLAQSYLDKKDNAFSAADAVKTIVSKATEPMGGDDVKAALVKAQDVFKAQMATNPDAGYAVDEIKGIIEKLPTEGASLISELTPEEKKDGFVMLFDGTNLDQWQGNLENYTVIDGTIYVDAAYGSGGNLYTKKKYSDFIYRFEFQFMVEGVNNGVGIRTPMNVDAAYEGMEIQILDHDAPIYRGLREYQQHGSVYGIIPAKRVKFPELGTWNTEEIRAIGDHITVTVNGEVILDGNIREACQGHNVAPDGGENTYTVDHQNHPGLFNKDGYISFCGHGTGVKFRNIRVKDMSKKRR